MGAGQTLYGRASDLAEMDIAAVEAADGNGGAVLVTGPAGMGKTALLNAFSDSRRAAGDLVLNGRASPDPGAPDYWPWAQILADARQALPQDLVHTVLGPRVSHLEALIGGMPATEVGPDTAASPGPAGSAHALYDAAMSLLSIAASDRPTVIVLDDAHHADRGSWNLLEMVIRGAVGTRLLTVTATRDQGDDLDAERQDQLSRLAPYGRRIELTGLVRSDVEAFLVARSGGTVPANVVDAVARLSGGNPLFVDELCVALAGGDDVMDLERHAPSLMATIKRVISTLSRPNRDLLLRAAIIGMTFDEPTLDQLGVESDGNPGRWTAGMLAELDRLGLIESAPDRQWRFAHELLRDSLLNGLSSAERIELHGRCAEIVRARPSGERGRAGAIAGHLVAAARAGGPVGTAVHQCRLAGIDAQERFAHGEAEYWWSVALELARHDPDVRDGERLDLLLELGSAQMRAGGAKRARQTFERARTLAGHVADPVGEARAAIGYADARVRGPGRETEVQDLRPDLEGAVDALERSSEKHPLVLTRALSHLASCLAMSSEPAAARDAANRAADVAAEDTSLEANEAALTAQRFAALDSVSLTERSEITEQLMLLAVQNNDPEAEWAATRWRVVDGLEAGDPDRVLHAVSTTGRLAERLLDPELRIHALIHHATVALLEGRFDRLDSLHAQAHAISAEVDSAIEPVLGQELFASRERGNLDIGSLRFILEARPLPIYRALVCWGSANLGRLEDTTADLDVFFDGTALPPLADDVYLLAILAMLAEAVCFVGDGDRAAAVRNRLAPYAGHCVLAGVGPYVWTGSVHHYLCQLSLTMGDIPGAAAHAEAALEVHERMGARPWVLRTQLAQARIAGANGDAVEARARFEEVASRADALSMPAIRDEAQAALAALGGARAKRGERWTLHPESGGWHLVTPRGEHRLPTRKGFRYLHDLLARPCREIHVVDLSRADGTVVDAGGAGSVLDDRAKEAYRRRVEDLREQVAEGEDWGDHERIARAQAELDAIAHELSAAVGLGGRDRRGADGAERVRINVTRAIRSAIEAVSAADPDAAAHLTTTVKTGTYCVYEPDPANGIVWET